MDSKALMTLDEKGMLARIEQAKFPQALSPMEKKLVAEIARGYGLDPIMNELSIYQGSPYPTVNAWYRKSQESGEFDGINSRPASKEERVARHAKEGDYLYQVEVWRKGCSHPFVGWGRVRAEETIGDKHLPIVKDPDRMAEKRGEMQGMRKAFSIPMPPRSFEEVSDAYSDGKAEEIIEGEVTEVPKEHWCSEHNCAFELKKSRFGLFYAHKLPGGKWCNEKKKEAAPAAEVVSETTESVAETEPEAPPPATKKAGEKSQRDPDTIKTINELLKACHEDWGMQPADVIKELGVSSQADISDTPAACYIQLELAGPEVHIVLACKAQYSHWPPYSLFPGLTAAIFR